MPKPAKGARLGSGPAHEKLLLGGLAAALIREERIRTTQAKAKRLKPVADRLVTLGKSGTIHARRQALRMITDRDIVHKLFDDVAPRFADRNGGYTRVLKLGPRKGDAAPMAIIEFVEGQVVEKTVAQEEEEKKRRLPLRRKGKSQTKAGASEPADADETSGSSSSNLAGQAALGPPDEDAVSDSSGDPSASSETSGSSGSNLSGQAAQVPPDDRVLPPDSPEDPTISAESDTTPDESPEK
ncbi:MAG TPA: 50S ribosomal protein L17 [Actinomycetota bacterium]|nr:50S ribosomal protein L17 [Actinomycetota bacterium]